jgi:hypothetical protein
VEDRTIVLPIKFNVNHHLITNNWCHSFKSYMTEIIIYNIYSCMQEIYDLFYINSSIILIMYVTCKTNQRCFLFWAHNLLMATKMLVVLVFFSLFLNKRLVRCKIIINIQVKIRIPVKIIIIKRKRMYQNMSRIFLGVALFFNISRTNTVSSGISRSAYMWHSSLFVIMWLCVSSITLTLHSTQLKK